MTTNTERQDRPDPGGVVRRGEAAEHVRRYSESFGEPPGCWVGKGLRDGTRCERPAVMEVYGLAMCEAHGEEAAAGALEEIAHDLEQELQRFTNPYVRSLSPHLEAALRRGSEVLDGAGVEERSDARLLEAFPLDRSRTCTETLAYAEDPSHYREPVDTPVDVQLSARVLVHRLMRLAFEADATWLVETLEQKRESVAEQAAYALALDREAGVR